MDRAFRPGDLVRQRSEWSYQRFGRAALVFVAQVKGGNVLVLNGSQLMEILPGHLQLT